MSIQLNACPVVQMKMHAFYKELKNIQINLQCVWQLFTLEQLTVKEANFNLKLLLVLILMDLQKKMELNQKIL